MTSAQSAGLQSSTMTTSAYRPAMSAAGLSEHTIGEIVEIHRREVKRTQARLKRLRQRGITAGEEYWELRHHLIRTQRCRDVAMYIAETVGPDALGYDEPRYH